MPRPFHPDRDVEAQNAFKKRVFPMLSGRLGGSLGPALIVYGSCSPTKRGSAGSTVLDHAGRQRVRPKVASQLIREFTYLYGAVSPNDGACCYLIMPAADTEWFQIFLDALAKRFARQYILLFVDGADNHSGGNLVPR